MKVKPLNLLPILVNIINFLDLHNKPLQSSHCSHYHDSFFGDICDCVLLFRGHSHWGRLSCFNDKRAELRFKSLFGVQQTNLVEFGKSVVD